MENGLLTMTEIIYCYAKTLYEYREIKEKSSDKENRRYTKINKLRAESKSLQNQYKKPKPDEQVLLQELNNITPANLRSMRRAEWHRRRRKERAKKKRMAF